jgi:replication factor C large subunit
MWSEKHRPKRLEEMVGNEDARAMVFDWLLNWKRGMKPLLLVGPPGVGKTTMAYAAAAQLGYSVIELNASDQRTKGELSHSFASVLSGSLLQENRLLLLDEVDGLYGRADFGGLEYLSEHLEELPIPAILCANDPESDQVRKLSKRARLVRVKRVPSRLAELYLRNVLDKEGKRLPEEVIIDIVSATRGDMRALLNAAQSTTGYDQTVYIRAPSYTVAEAVNGACNSTNLEEALVFLQECDADQDEKLMGCYYTIVGSASLTPERRLRALRGVAEAALLLRRIRSTQQWRLLRYFDRMLAGAVYGLKVSYSDDPLSFPAKLRIWNDSKSIKTFCSLIAKETGISSCEISAKHLGPILLFMSRWDGGIEGWCSSHNLEQPITNTLLREVKNIIARIGK